MRTLLVIAAVALTGFFTAPRAEAGSCRTSPYTYRSGHASCGCPQYTTRYFRGYDRCGRPVYSYVRHAFRHSSSCRHRSHQRHSNYYRSSRTCGPRVSIFSRTYSRSHSPHYRSSSHRSHSHRGYSSSRTCR